ncbi:MAG: hypothetical protein JSS31_00680 [Proteobacteria bacterium]|nr:hypothetical protein [Pseudomonadota bacterium]MBS0492469.1 hypothetical protein [Pseudomonadota bacterium]
MPLMHNARRTARLLLGCFALSLLVAMAAPWVQARPLERLCTASGQERWVAPGGNDAGAPPHQAHQIDCVLCLPPMLPGAAAAHLSSPQEPPAVATAIWVRMAHVPAQSRAPFPPRAPPALPPV